jgi:membrane protein DedA with SNARE-associated domain
MMHEIAHLLHQYGPVLIFAVIAVECAGVILPGETVLITASLYASHGHINIFLVVALAAAGAIAGNVAGYLLGRLLGETLLARHGWRVGLTARRLALGRYLFARHGGKMVFFSRFAAVLRSFAGLLAGANLMRWRYFLLWTVIGGIAWPATIGFAVFLLGNAAKRLSGPASIVFGVLAAGCILGAILLARRNEERLTEAALHWQRCTSERQRAERQAAEGRWT